MKSICMSCLVFIITGMIAVAPVSVMAAEQQPEPQTAGDSVQAQADTGTNISAGVPKIFFPDSSFNFGTADQREHLTHIFKVQNIGDAPLKIIGAHAS